MIKFTRYIILIVIFIKIQFYLLGSDSTLFHSKWFDRVGLLSSYNYNTLSTDLRQVPTIPDSIRYFSTGNSSGFSLGIFSVFPLSSKLSIHARLLYTNGFARISGTAWSEAMIDNRDTFSLINHIFTTDLQSFGLEPLLEFELIKNLSLLGGIILSYRLDQSYQHIEELIKPDSGYFLNNSRTRIVENEFTNLSGFQSAFTAGISYKLPFSIANNGRITLNLLYSYGFSSIAENFIWDINIMRAGINFEYYFNAPEKKLQEPIEQEQKIDIKEETKDTIAQKQIIEDKLKSRIDLNILEIIDNREIELKNIEILQSIRENSFPLLNYIFFANGSAEIPNRYYRLSYDNTKNYSYTIRRPIGDEINNGIKYVYYDILNIIGYRLQQNKDTRITLIGCNSDTLNEKGASILSLQRAKAVQSYLTDVWNISSQRIEIENRNLPANPSNNNTVDGIEENQRVEIISYNPKIFEPVVYNDTVITIEPTSLRFRINKEGVKSILYWKIEILQGQTVKKKIEYEKDFPEIFDIELNDIPLNLNDEDSINIYARFIFFNDQNVIDTFNINKSIGLKRTKHEKKDFTKSSKQIERYNLILFDFNKAILDKENLYIINEINKKIKNYNKKIISLKVIGYTDRIGDSKYNLELSKMRAFETAKNLKFQPIITTGYGEDKLIFDNSLPEGRFYSRTVEIIIERIE